VENLKTWSDDKRLFYFLVAVFFILSAVLVLAGYIYYTNLTESPANSGYVHPPKRGPADVIALTASGIILVFAGAGLCLHRHRVAYYRGIVGTEEALRRSEEKYRRLYESLGDGFVFVDMDGRIKEYNETYREMIGYGREEIMGLTFMDITPEKWRALEKHIITEQILPRGFSDVFEKEYRRKDGSVFPVELRAFLVKNKEGGIEGMWAIVRDITGRKQAEKALLESERVYHNLFNNTEIAMFRSRLDGSEVLNVNEKFLELVGKTRDEVVGKPSSILWVDPDRREEMVRKLKADGRVRDFEFRMINEKLGVRDCLTSLNIYSEEGILDGSILDITEHKQQERAIISANEEWKRTFDSVPDLVALLDTEFRIKRLNRGMAARFGASPEQLIGRRCYEVIHGTSEPPEFCPHRRLLESGREEGSEIVDKKLGGLFEVRTTPVHDKNGNLIGSVHIMRDITEHRKLEDQLRQVMKMEGIGQLAGGIAHDFNNVLNAVVGYASLLQMKMEKADPLRHFADEIVEAGMRGAALTQQILAFSRKQLLDLKPVDLNEIIRGLGKMLHRLVREDIEIKMELENELVVLADSGQISQVLINLSTNARDAMPGIGVLSLGTRVFLMDADYVKMHGYGVPGEYALLTVSDTGVGIDEATRKHMFEPFFTTKEAGSGTGLGLAVVHGIVKQHNGYIDVYSEKGKGTVFNIYLPLTGRTEEDAEEGGTGGVRGGNETILIAEDDASIRNLSTLALTHYGYKVIEAVDGEDAAAKYREHRNEIKLVILDGIMPKKGGKEAFEEIRRINPDMKAIFLSGYSEDIFSTSGMSGLQAMFLQKPVRPSSLAKKVREALDA